MRFWSFIAIGSMAAVAGGCTVSTNDGTGTVVEPIDGTATFDWSLNSGMQDSLVCSDFDADSLDVVIYAEGNPNGTEFTEVCEAFVLTVSLPPGNYSATAQLLDINGNARTTPLDISPFRIVSNTDLSIPLDFPADSFF